MSVSFTRNIGAYVRTVVGFKPTTIVSTAASTSFGLGIDRTGHLSCVLQLVGSTGTGTATINLSARVQHSASSGSGFTDLSTGAGVSSIANTTGDDVDKEVNVDLHAAKKFIRVGVVGDIGASTTGSVTAAAVVVLGPKDESTG